MNIKKEHISAYDYYGFEIRCGIENRVQSYLYQPWTAQTYQGMVETIKKYLEQECYKGTIYKYKFLPTDQNEISIDFRFTQISSYINLTLHLS